MSEQLYKIYNTRQVVKHFIRTGVNSLNTFEIELNKVLLKNVLSRTGYIYGLFKIILIQAAY